MADKIESRTLLENAFNKIRDLKSQLEKKNNETEAIAIVGMSCRLPGSANNVEEFWDNILNGKDCIVDLNSQRWDHKKYYDKNMSVKGKTYSPKAGLIDKPFDFDADFFNITPREAEWMDPQQRHLLEVSWEALENAGIPADKVRGAKAGVYVGVMNKDHSDLMVQQLQPNQLLPMMNTGNHESVHSGRLSYFFDFNGPCLTLNTACSSSLLSIHLACQAIRNEECDFALAGGCNMLLSPFSSVAQSQATMHSTDGHCKTFDDSADGYVRSEGCAMVVLKPLSRALKDNDQIHSVILGSAINQDGLSQGITAPNGRSQEKVMRSALANAKVKPDQVNFVESHGTGTKLGDPIEIRALGSVYGRAANRKKALYVGALKSNIGHCESASGVAGLIKLTQVLKTGSITKNLHCNNVNKDIDLHRENIALPNKTIAWDKSSPKIGAVSSFGFSGSNAHFILSAPDPVDSTDGQPDRDFHILRISGKNHHALKNNIIRTIDFLEKNESEKIADICYSYNVGRSEFANRIMVYGRDKDEILTALKNSQNNIFESNVKPVKKVLNNAMVINEFRSEDYAVCSHLYQSNLIFQKSFDKIKEKIETSFECLLPVDQMSVDSKNSSLYYLLCLYALKDFFFSFNVNPTMIVCSERQKNLSALFGSNAPLDDWINYSKNNFNEIDNLDRDSISKYVFFCEKNKLEKMDESSVIQKFSVLNINRFIKLGSANTFFEVDSDSVNTLNLFDDVCEPWKAFSSHLCEIYNMGFNVDTAVWDSAYSRRKVTVSTYAFKKTEYWLDVLNRSVFGDNDKSISTVPNENTLQKDMTAVGMSAEDFLLHIISDISKIEVKEIKLENRLMESMGFDSIMISEIRGRLAKRYASLKDIPFELLYEDPLIKLVDYVKNNSGQVFVQDDIEDSSEDNSRMGLDDIISWLDDWEKIKKLNTINESGRLDKKLVHKHKLENVLIENVAQPEVDGWYCAKMYQDNDHEFFYEHYQDHVPGLYLIEAARQFGIACTHMFHGVPLNYPFVLDDMNVQFDRFAEKNKPVYIVSTFSNTYFLKGVLNRIDMSSYFVQDGDILGVVSGKGVILEAKEYQKKRVVECA